MKKTDKILVPHQSRSCCIGDTFGKLTVLETLSELGKRKYYALCQCSCGSEPTVHRIDSMKTGKIVSCGCFQKEQVTTHGNRQHPLYKRWLHMLERCENQKHPSYARYGGRGITVCDRWHDFRLYAEDVFPTYIEGMTLDRINNDGNYEPTNFRWISFKEQNLNYSRNVRISYAGKTLTILEWSQLLNVPYGSLWDRIKVQGMSASDALTLPYSVGGNLVKSTS